MVEGADQAHGMSVISDLTEIVVANISYIFPEAALSYTGMVGMCLQHHVALALTSHCTFLSCQTLITENN